MLIGDIMQAPRAADYNDLDGSVMMICDGRAISRAVYATLFGLCGVAYGPGDGLTTFNIPQFGLSGGMQGRSPIGASPAGGYPLGAQGGVEQHGHTVAGVSVDHLAAGPTSPSLDMTNAYQAGGAPVAASGHPHVVTSPIPGLVHAPPNPDNAGWITSSLGTGLFIKVL